MLVFKNQWSGDHLDFRASLLGQRTTRLLTSSAKGDHSLR